MAADTGNEAIYTNADGSKKKSEPVLEEFHRLMIEALRQREGEIIQFVAIIAAALGGFAWLAQAANKVNDAGCDKLSNGAFATGTAGVVFLLFVGAIYAVALGYNFRYIIMQIAKLENSWEISNSRLVKWPKMPRDFIDRYGCYCRPPEIIQVFWFAFIVAIIGVTLAACFLRSEALVLSVMIPCGFLCACIGVCAPFHYARKMRRIASDEDEKGGWKKS